ncbi:MAG: MFS transporter [Alphaproteobacteria bacterium]|nr:MFS transporter [Alphaproteobacteria bacterium]
MEKPQLSFWRIWNMCFGFFGIQVGFGLQNANVSRIFQTLGADVGAIPILWIAAPLTGLLVQPIVGYMSDRTWGGLGRRRPYFFYGALATTAALFLMPNSPALWIAAGALWIMDASINVTMEPFRAFVGDMLPHRQRTTGFAMQSFFIGLGAVLASAMPWILTNWFSISNVAPEGVVPPSVKYAFYIGGVFVFIAVMWTVLTTREYSPEQMQAFDKADNPRDVVAAAQDGDRAPPTPSSFFRNGGLWLVASGVATILIAQLSLEKELYVLSVGGVAFGLMQISAGLLKQRGRVDNAFSEIIEDLFTMPRTMKQLAIVQFFSWFALFSMWIYTTSAVTAHHYGATDAASAAYNQGADWVGILFAAYNGVAALAAFAIPMLAARTNRKAAHAICLLCGAAGFASFLVIRDPALLLLSMVGVGVAWASILSVPYAILSGSLPSGKMGVYMGIFNFFIVIPQLTAASILGVLVRNLFAGHAIYALLAGGLSLGLAAVAMLFVEDPAEAAIDAAPGGAAMAGGR